MDFTAQVVIDRPPDVVWRTLADVGNWPSWTASMREISWPVGMPVTEGAAVRVKQPRLPPLTWTVTQYIPGEAFTWESASPGVRTRATHVIRSLPEGKSEVTLGVHQSGPLAGLAALFFGRMTRRYMQMEAAGLKRQVESMS